MKSISATTKAAILALAGGLVMAATSAHAAFIRVDDTRFGDNANLITFSEFDLGTRDPVYDAADYGGDVDHPMVAFGGWFKGQSLSTQASASCSGATGRACIVGTPDPDLSLDPSAINTVITNDAANATSPVLGGQFPFSGSIAITFSSDQSAVGFVTGFLEVIGTAEMTAYDRDGGLIGMVANEGMGIEFLGLASDEANIAGVFLNILGEEPAGFAIDNVRFQGEIMPAPVPLPAGLPLALIGMAALVGVSRLARRKTQSRS